MKGINDWEKEFFFLVVVATNLTNIYKYAILELDHFYKLYTK